MPLTDVYAFVGWSPLSAYCPLRNTTHARWLLGSTTYMILTPHWFSELFPSWKSLPTGRSLLLSCSLTSQSTASNCSSLSKESDPKAGIEASKSEMWSWWTWRPGDVLKSTLEHEVADVWFTFYLVFSMKIKWLIAHVESWDTARLSLSTTGILCPVWFLWAVKSMLILDQGHRRRKTLR